ncbi:phosphotransferase [Schaalia sp. Marseille-Q2122]|uniref:phosphotransferase n=1 Tax=Schaalia sp. Marseille-Q2122 TaxID=2736604 RepID=UPI00158AB152|nr:phosphotransferase [Schaalia sp. Marseille-Q2122]
MNTLEALNLLLDGPRLSELYGRDVRVNRLRIKPEVSIIASVKDAHTDAELGWMRLLWPVSHSKARKASQQAEANGYSTVIREMSDGLICDSGPIATDPALLPYFAELGTIYPSLPFHPLGSENAQILRYNPLRRLVVRNELGVVRVQANPSVLTHELYTFLESIVPLPERMDTRTHSIHHANPHMPSAYDYAGVVPMPAESAGKYGVNTGQHASVLAYCGNSDLSACDNILDRDTVCLAYHYDAGRLFAGLHLGIAVMPPRLASAVTGRASNPRRQAMAHAGILEYLSASTARRMRDIASSISLPSGSPLMLSHGDASPDQVLIEGSTGRLWLTDFDRVCLAPATKDVGSYIAECDEEQAEAFLSGYAAGGAYVPALADIRMAQAASLMERAVEPLRTGDPLWHHSINTRLDRIEELIR